MLKPAASKDTVAGSSRKCILTSKRTLNQNEDAISLDVFVVDAVAAVRAGCRCTGRLYVQRSGKLVVGHALVDHCELDVDCPTRHRRI